MGSLPPPDLGEYPKIAESDRPDRAENNADDFNDLEDIQAAHSEFLDPISVLSGEPLSHSKSETFARPARTARGRSNRTLVSAVGERQMHLSLEAQ